MAILSKGQTFADAGAVTSTKLNNLVDNAAFVTGSSGSTDDSSLEVNGSGRLQVKDGGISAAKLGAGVITNAKLADSTSAITGVTYSKIQYVANMKALGNTTGALAAPSEVSILDEDDMVSDSATSLATQQSIKAYVDNTTGLILGTSVATTSGTSFDFTGIPTTVKRINVNFDNVALSGTNNILVQIGEGSVETTGYVSGSGNRSSEDTSTSGFIIGRNGSTHKVSGVLTLFQRTGSNWVSSHSVNVENSVPRFGGGRKTITGDLTTLRITRSGTDTFSLGDINISYE